MKIAHISPVYPPYHGGIGSVAYEYANALAHDDNVTVFTPLYENVSHDDSGGVEVRRLKPLYKWGNAALLPQLLWQLKNFDIIHLHYTFYGASFFTAIASLMWRKPLIVTYHMRPVATGWLGWIFKTYRFFIEPMIFAISKVICVSSLDYAHSVNLNSKKLIELPFSVDVNRFFPVKELAEREKLDIDKNAKVIIFVGGLDDAHYFKGVDILIKACAKISNKINWHLIIVGDGNKRKEYEDLAMRESVKEKVSFVGRVSDENLPKYYQFADIHVLPAINRCEAFGLVTLEAASSGLPSIVSNLPGVRTLVNNYKTGLIVEPSNIRSLTKAFERLLKDNQLRYEFGKEARSRIEKNFTSKIIHEKLKKIYKNVRVGS